MIVALLAASLLVQPAPLTAADAKAHVGEQATVCGVVKSARWASRATGNRRS